uniref:Tubulin delta chain n=1 Tax=Ciona intestinalis TaxID=7719 RepID=Q8T887_CIOIN|nr:delta-tubulin [Ciona intestinalis]BAB85852.1 delta-tubulin [Ciona intestinalis]|eukprot:NP_001027643.1 delta-tubulin [Ciona intestinalis]
MASCVTVQLGQCGTQIGHELLDILYEDACQTSTTLTTKTNNEYKDTSLKTFFHETGSGYEARSVMVDMEPKAVNCALSGTSGKGWSYAKRQQFCQKSGSGNNWAYGFKVHAPRCKDGILDCIRREVEKCDYFSGFLILMSLAGGTGSGVGSYITGLLREEYPHATLINPVVCPYTAGEVAVQNYNAILSLSNMCATTDANILLHNNHLHEVCQKLLGLKHVTFTDMNSVAASQLASLLQPISASTSSMDMFSQQQRDVLSEIVLQLACNGQYKLLDIKSVPHIPVGSVAYSTFEWEALVKRIYQMHITDYYMDEGLNWKARLPATGLEEKCAKYPSKYLSTLLIMRGLEASSFDPNLSRKFTDSRLYANWMPEYYRCAVWKTDKPFQKYEKSLTIVSNGTPCIKPLNMTVEKAWDMFGARAYLHQYTKYGLEETDFINAFVAVENLISVYKKL